MLGKIAETIRENKAILEKRELNPIIQYIDLNSFKNNSRIYSDIGQDSAAIHGDNKYILLTTDRIRTSYIEKFPYGAGFSSVLVGVDDIYACGGIPIAASIIISFVDRVKGEKILEGVCEGSKKFQVPIIRGHTKINSKCYELSSTMIGEISPKEDYISALGSRVGDKIILAVDFDGRVGKASKLYWDTVTFKDSGVVLNKRKSMNEIAQRHLATASKDVSNGGIFGTILQMTRYSNVGADINITNLEIPPKLLQIGYDLETYVQMFLSTSYVLTASKENCKSMIKTFNKHGLEANVIGEVTKHENTLRLNDGDGGHEIIKF